MSKFNCKNTKAGPLEFEPSLVTGIPELDDSLVWGPEKTVQTVRGERRLRVATVTPEFWEAWRREKEGIKALGIGCGKDKTSGEWEVTWWRDVPQEEKEQRTAAEMASRQSNSDFHVPVPEGKELHGYQKAGVHYSVECYNAGLGCLIGDQMGLGKTIQAIGFINSQQWVKQVLIICPKSVKRNWFLELYQWQTRGLGVAVQEASEPWQGWDYDIVIVNFDIVKRYPQALEREWDLRIIDECHNVKNPKAARTIATLATRARMKIALSGTPMENGRHEELYTTISDLDPNRWNPKKFFPNFAMRYCAARRVKVPIWKMEQTPYGPMKVKKLINIWDTTGASNAAELQQILRSTIMIRRKTEDVLKELPAVRQQIIEIPSDGVMELLKEEPQGDESYAEQAKAIAGGKKVEFDRLSKVRLELGLAKVDFAVEWISEVMDGDDGVKAIVFAHHPEVLQRMAKKFEGSAMIIGETSNRQGECDRFNTDPKCRLIFGNDAMKEGLNLQAASQVIFVEGSWVPGNISQKIARAARMGQKKSVMATHLVWERSLDARMIRSSVGKMERIERGLDAA